MLIAGQPKQATSQRVRNLLLTALAATVVVAAMIAVNRAGVSEPRVTPAAPGEPAAGAAEVERAFAGIPQDGISLGRPDAPVTIVEYVDPQCPFCARFAEDTLPGLLDRVRAGKVRIELRVLSFLGPDSQRGARAVAAAAAQDRGWQMLELMFRNQGAENSGYLNEDFVRQMAAGAGLDPEQIVLRSGDEQSQRALTEADVSAQAAGVQGTPSLIAGPTGGKLELLTSGTPPETLKRIDSLAEQSR